jgi:hypothetical protein
VEVRVLSPTLDYTRRLDDEGLDVFGGESGGGGSAEDGFESVPLVVGLCDPFTDG